MSALRPLWTGCCLMLFLSACGDAQVETNPTKKGDSAKEVAPTGVDTTSTGASTGPLTEGAGAPIDPVAPTPQYPPVPPDLKEDIIPLTTPDGKPARMGVKSGRLTFKYDRDLRGVRIVTFDDYGLKERIYDKFVPYPPNAPGPIREIIGISTPEFRAQYQPRSNSAYRDENVALKEYLASDSSKTMNFAEYILTRMHAKRLPDTVLGGYPVRVITAQSQGGPSTWWMWRGITLQETGEFTQANKRHLLVLQSMELNIDVPDSLFEIPSRYKIERPPAPPRPADLPNPPKVAPGTPMAPLKPRN